jgi:hypothetical protein
MQNTGDPNSFNFSLGLFDPNTKETQAELLNIISSPNPLDIISFRHLDPAFHETFKQQLNNNYHCFALNNPDLSIFMGIAYNSKKWWITKFKSGQIYTPIGTLSEWGHHLIACMVPLNSLSPTQPFWITNFFYDNRLLDQSASLNPILIDSLSQITAHELSFITGNFHDLSQEYKDQTIKLLQEKGYDRITPLDKENPIFCKKPSHLSVNLYNGNL